MKILFIISLIILFISCSEEKSDSPLEPGSSSTGSFSANIGLLEWDAETVRAYKQNNYTRVNGTQTITSSNSEYSSISLFIDILYLKEPKLFGIGEDGNGLNYSANAKVEATLKDGANIKTYIGQYIDGLSLLDVIEIDDRHIRGTFEFRGFIKGDPTDSLNITEGRFNIKF